MSWGPQVEGSGKFEENELQVNFAFSLSSLKLEIPQSFPRCSQPIHKLIIEPGDEF